MNLLLLRKPMNFLIQSNVIKGFIASFLLLITASSYAQYNPETFEIRGVIHSEDGKNKQEKVEFAAVSIPQYRIGTYTDENGNFILKSVPAGKKVKLSVRYVGKVDLDTLIDVNKDLSLNLFLQEENFRLTEVVVTAVNSQAGQSTASKISRNAIDHLQSTSLSDLMSLLPGGLTNNQDLGLAKQVNIRNAATEESSSKVKNMNAFGVSIIKNGAPLSNNANLQTMNPTISGETGVLSGGTPPSGGTDVRLISTDNIESIEVIRGIPSVQYGDLTSGAIIINSKAGRTPLNVKMKANPNLYEVSASSGFSLGEKKGSLNLSGDYAHNTYSITQSYVTYQRSNLNLLYSNFFFNRLTNNTSLDLTYGADRRRLNPDDEITRTKSKGDNLGARLTTNGTLNLNKSWLTNIRYSASASYTAKKSYYSTQHNSATSSYSMTTTDGAVLSNKPGVDVYDKDGNKITNIPSGEESLYAVALPASYVGRNDIDGKEINAFAKLTANLHKRLGRTNHAIMLGVDFKTDGNVGDGKTFDPRTPPMRGTGNVAFRARPYKDIPFVNQLGVYAEEDFSFKFADRTLNITGGLRYDRISVVKDVFSPRVNASFEVLPNTFFIRGGYGVTAKAPSVLFLYPEKAYFEYININETANEAIPEDERHYITTTHTFETENKDFKIAKNKKAEIGFDLKIKQATLSVRAFKERLENGYAMEYTVNTFKPLIYKEYKRTDEGLILSASNPILAKYYTPTNNLNINSKGIDFDLNLGRFDAIRTAFSVNGMWIRTESYSNNYTFYDGRSGSDGASRTHVGVYEPRMETKNDQQFTTSMRVTHNIPEIGFVITLTGQAIWQDWDWYNFKNNTTPIKFISKKDGLLYDDLLMLTDDEYKLILRDIGREGSEHIKEKQPVAITFNINVTKEIGNNLRASFFANNMFRNYPRTESTRYPGSYLTKKHPIFFGIELSLKI